ncbi:hypothetical protein [Methylorubrum suomiense]|uniref:Uncharacterized protein n=1 Tax=Methylorubrum suomiense TaxID=144191 RepID=A0ABQ4V3V5_9HYPH|nr:hypothetical protein [Methylorubrum suomiense]GJE78640.1 hypothetical protein BGCPKDLD_5258 [Methylorubrum suomiense]
MDNSGRQLQRTLITVELGCRAGEAWAESAPFERLIQLAGRFSDDLSHCPDELSELLRSVLDPYRFTGNAWTEMHLGSPEPSPDWMRGFAYGAIHRLEHAFRFGREAQRLIGTRS